MAYVATLYVAANILFDLETGKTTQVLLLANNERDATVFNEKDAISYLEFVRRRARNIDWSIHPLVGRPGAFVIMGTQVQNV